MFTITWNMWHGHWKRVILVLHCSSVAPCVGILPPQLPLQGFLWQLSGWEMSNRNQKKGSCKPAYIGISLIISHYPRPWNFAVTVGWIMWIESSQSISCHDDSCSFSSICFRKQLRAGHVWLSTGVHSIRHIDFPNAGDCVRLHCVQLHTLDV